MISTQENIRALAKAKAVKPEDIALILDRPRHADLIAAVRKAGASVRLITDGDVAGVIHTADPESTGIDIYFGIGGAPEGVLAAATLACIGGQFQGRLVLDAEKKRARAAKNGRRGSAQEISAGGRGDGRLPFRRHRCHHKVGAQGGGRFREGLIETETVVMRSVTGTVRLIRAEHRQFGKFHLE